LIGRKWWAIILYDIMNKEFTVMEIPKQIRVRNEKSWNSRKAGIIAAKRNNGSGANGGCKIMVEIYEVIEQFPNGGMSMKPKDIALGIPTNQWIHGAKNYNGRFGKAFSSNPPMVRCIKYASGRRMLSLCCSRWKSSGERPWRPNHNPIFPNDQNLISVLKWRICY